MAKNTIKLKKYLDVIEEYTASGAITPGMLLEYDSAGKVKAHSSSGGTQVQLIALEDELQGKGINDAYALADQVQVWVAQRGEQAYMILQDGENVAIGDYLVSNGDGTLKKYVAQEESSGPDTIIINSIVAQSLEAKDLSDSSGGESSGDLGYDKRICVRFI